MPHGIEISGEDCRGCVNCIKSCPTEAIRVINGKVRILEERCIGCGECLRICSHRAISLQGTDWDSISGIRPMALVMDPALFSQFPWPPNPAIMEEILRDMGF
ncbi:MAG TPA: 4Fe-4S binding protein, partial [Synergistales bacterium]|nr:4Fe-4S binding protein [Synergistales bacterium]